MKREQRLKIIEGYLIAEATIAEQGSKITQLYTCVEELLSALEMRIMVGIPSPHEAEYTFRAKQLLQAIDKK